jgi:hypothetical protein
VKTPVTPPNLLAARDELKYELDRNPENPAEAAARAVKQWHWEVRYWQDYDSLEDAFAEGRLTLRIMSNEDKVREYPNMEDAARFRLVRQINNSTYKKPMLEEAVRTETGDAWTKGAKLPENKERLVDAGGTGIVQRLNPMNFNRSGLPNAPQSAKTRLGLHDLSGSLLDPDKANGGVTIGKWDVNLAALQPLPMFEDVALFYRVRDLSKTRGTQDFRGAVAVMASEFTRPKIASAGDMGAQYVITTSRRHGGESIKYIKGDGTNVTSTDSPDQCAQNARTDYRKILGGKLANEITIVYRKWGNLGRFPVFVFGGKTGPWTEIQINMPGGDEWMADYVVTGVKYSRSTYKVV